MFLVCNLLFNDMKCSMKKIGLIVLFFVIICSVMKSQDYNTSVGVRIGLFNGITAKHFITMNTNVEGMLSTRWGGLVITGLYEIQYPAFEVDHLYWYVGAGGHAGFLDDYRNRPANYSSNAIIGVDGIIGLEYNFTEVPLNISLDWKPMFNFIEEVDFWGDDIGLSVRYLF